MKILGRLTYLILTLAVLSLISSAKSYSQTFSELMISGSFDVEMIVMPDCAGKVAVDPKYADFVDVRRGADALFVSSAKGRLPVDRIPIKIYYADDLSLLEVSGRSDVKCPSLHVPYNVSVVVTGSSNVSVGDIYASGVNISLTGSGRINVLNQIVSSTLNLSLTGRGRISADGVGVNTLSANERGSGRVNVTGSASTCSVVVNGTGMADLTKIISNEMTLKLFGEGTIYYPGGIRVKTDGNKENIKATKPFKSM